MEINKVERSFGTYLMNFIKSKVTCVEDAKDIYQEVLVKIIDKSGSLTKEESLKSWVFAIARNQVIDYYRSKKIPELLSDSILDRSVERRESKVHSELESCMHAFINLLPTEYKELIIKSDIDGTSQKELSETIGINYVTLRSKVQRGRERIRNMILDSCNIEKDAAGGLLECEPRSSKDFQQISSSCGCN